MRVWIVRQDAPGCQCEHGNQECGASANNGNAMNKRFGINLLAVWLNHGLGIASGLVLTPLILNRIGDANYGLWLFIGSIFAYSGLLNLGFGRTVSRYVASYHARSDWIELNRIVSVTMAVYLVMAIIALLGTSILAVCVPYVSTWSNVPVTCLKSVSAWL